MIGEATVNRILTLYSAEAMDGTPMSASNSNSNNNGNHVALEQTSTACKPPALGGSANDGASRIAVCEWAPTDSSPPPLPCLTTRERAVAILEALRASSPWAGGALVAIVLGGVLWASSHWWFAIYMALVVLGWIIVAL